MPRTFKPSSVSKVPEDASFDNSLWNYFLILEEDFKNTLRYIELTEKNWDCFSLELSKQLICIATEFENICKALCKEINGTTPGNLKEYKEIILKEFPNIWNTNVFIDYKNQMEIKPLASWENIGGQLDWWNAYGNIKHNRYNNFQSASLKNTLYALSSLLILEAYLYKKAYPYPSSMRIGTKLLRTPGLGEAFFYSDTDLPDFQS